MTSLRDRIALATRTKSSKYLSDLAPPIEVKITRCVDYSALLRGEHTSASEASELLAFAVKSGRVILSGRGASGKSALLHRVAVAAADLGYAPFFISLALWDHTASHEWRTVGENARESFDFLLRRFGSSGHDIADAEFLPDPVQKMFLLDGLNETPGSTADEILAACDRIASLMLGASVIVTDRLVRRNVNDERRWIFAMPLPVEAQERARLTTGMEIPSGAEALLASPFFLDRAIKGELRKSPLLTIRELFEQRGKLDPSGLSAAAKAAFRAYEVDRSRTFDPARFEEMGRSDVANTLLSGGLLARGVDGRLAFAHHWYHDYLASKYVVECPGLWTFENRHRTLDSLTFSANSFDAIAFALELLSGAATGAFLQAVYDWNPYAAGYALAEASIKVEDVPADVRFVILAMLAEKRFDRQFLSARRAGDALDLLDDENARRMRQTKSLSELYALITSERPRSDEFAKWQALFTLRQGDLATLPVISALSDENSMMGWATANVLKRLQLARDHQQMIVSFASHSRPVVRWRAVHVMGGFVIDEFISTLFARLDQDEDENVKYGALRSLIEVASRDSDTLSKIVKGIADRVSSIKSSPRLLSELSRAVFLAPGVAPKNWAQEISQVFYALLERASEPIEAERWSKLASRLRVHHRPESELAA